MEKKVVAGIVAEYNPFHNGHLHQIETTRQAGATHIVAVMSGNFVQRGGCACAQKFVRANAAVACGVDLVLELPVAYAMATAERFSYGALSILGKLGCVDVLSFGSECGEVELLIKAAHAVLSPYCSEYTKTLLAQGITYARARQKSVEKLYGMEVANVLSSPNNTLAVEYLRQIILQNLKIVPYAVVRKGAEHDSTAPMGQIASASLLRNLLDLESVESLSPFVPSAAMNIYRSAATNGLLPFGTHSLNTAVLSSLRTMNESDFADLPDISEGLDHRVFNAVRRAVSFDELLAEVKTKRYPLARIRRLIWNAYLRTPAHMFQTPPPYARVLAFNKKGKELLSEIVHAGAIPVSHSLAKLEQINPTCAEYAQLESKATDLFVLGLPTIQPCGSEYRQKITMQSCD